MMLVKELYNRKLVKAKRFCELNSFQKTQLQKVVKNLEWYKDNGIFLEPDMTLGYGTYLGLGVWRPANLYEIEILIEDYKE